MARGVTWPAVGSFIDRFSMPGVLSAAAAERRRVICYGSGHPLLSGGVRPGDLPKKAALFFEDRSRALDSVAARLQEAGSRLRLYRVGGYLDFPQGAHEIHHTERLRHVDEIAERLALLQIHLAHNGILTLLSPSLTLETQLPASCLNDLEVLQSERLAMPTGAINHLPPFRYHFRKSGHPHYRDQIDAGYVILGEAVFPEDFHPYKTSLPRPSFEARARMPSDGPDIRVIPGRPNTETDGGWIIEFGGTYRGSPMPPHRLGFQHLAGNLVIVLNQGKTDGESLESGVYRNFAHDYGVPLHLFAVLLARHVAKRLGAQFLLGTAAVNRSDRKRAPQYWEVFRRAGMDWIGVSAYALRLDDTTPWAPKALRSLRGGVDLEALARWLVPERKSDLWARLADRLTRLVS